METKLKITHEEKFVDSEKILGALVNYNTDFSWYNTLFFIYDNGVYIFFETMIDMLDYLLNGDYKVTRAYMKEDVFDELYDKPFINGDFSKELKWWENPQNNG